MIVDPEMLPAEYVVALYWQRWRIADAFNVVKRLLGLAYFWSGSINGVQEITERWLATRGLRRNYHGTLRRTKWRIRWQFVPRTQG